MAMAVGKLAWRNLWRRKRRTLITALSIAFGVLLAVTFTGTGDYAYSNMIDASANMGLGHLTVQPRGYSDTPSLDKRLQETDALRAGLLQLAGVDNAYVRIMGQAMFASAAKNVGGVFLGIDPGTESATHNLLLRSLVEGELFARQGRGVLVGSKLAEQLNLRLGKKLVYTTTDSHGDIVSEIARVSGIFRTGADAVDGSTAVLPIDALRRTLNYAPGEASLVAVLIDDQRHASAMSETIAARFGDPQREVLPWQRTQPEIAGVVAMDRSGNYISQLLVGLLVAAGILNTLLMSVLERTREFGVMMALGMAPRTLFRLVLSESLWLALLGLGLGVIITMPWFLYLYHVGIDFSAAIGQDYSAGGVLVDPVLRIRLYRESVLAILSGVLALTLSSGLYPAWRAARVPPVQSLKAL
jgi:ABC-type lipoprotein release transport system permease subunit